MNRNKILTFFFVAAVVVFAGRFSFGQETAKPGIRDGNYEAMLYVVLGSNDTAPGSELPKSISGVTRQLRDHFTFNSYRLLNTYVGRVANNGSLEYKSIASLQDSDRELDSPSFLEWNLVNLRSGDSPAGGDLLVMQAFRFGARVPVRLVSMGEGGKSNTVANYENVGLNVNRLGITQNSPTLIGTISLPRTTGTVFLVLSVRPV